MTSLNGNILSPSGSLDSSGSSTAPSTPQQPQQFPENGNHQHPQDSNCNPTKASTPSGNGPSPKEEVVVESQAALLELVDVSKIYFNDDAATESKEGSPFYAEPAYSLNAMHQKSLHRNLFPPPQLTKTPATPIVESPLDGHNDRIPIILCQPSDALKTPGVFPYKQRRHEPWPLDSSWEFMNVDANDNDYDTDEHWNTIQRHQPYPSSTAETAKISDSKKEQFSKPSITVQQLILAKMPELGAKLTNISGDSLHSKYTRMSSYDNVDKKHSGYRPSILQVVRSVCGSSVHSDDGTVFSEPWDSSQWDTLSFNQGKYYQDNSVR